jgi:hypothetical protein
MHYKAHSRYWSRSSVRCCPVICLVGLGKKMLSALSFWRSIFEPATFGNTKQVTPTRIGGYLLLLLCLFNCGGGGSSSSSSSSSSCCYCVCCCFVDVSSLPLLLWNQGASKQTVMTADRWPLPTVCTASHQISQSTRSNYNGYTNVICMCVCVRACF